MYQSKIAFPKIQEARFSDFDQWERAILLPKDGHFPVPEKN
jgi:hypothetical protein